MTLTRLADSLANEVARDPVLCVRLQRADGSALEGQVLGISETDVSLVDSATGELIRVSAQELHAVDVRMPRRGRELILAICAIPVATAALVAYARLPWVRAEQADIAFGFLILWAIVHGLMSISRVRRSLRSWLTRWQRLEPR